MSKNYEIAILGGGPGGYVAAIRAGQLGLKTVLIDYQRLGGICLNWGCIPTKSLLKNAELFDTMKNHSADFGIKVTGLEFDFSKIIKRSRDISDRITKNVEILVKKNKVDRIKGYGKLSSKNQIDIYDESGKKNDSINADKIIIATGARPKMIPMIPVDKKNIITSTEAMILDELPKGRPQIKTWLVPNTKRESAYKWINDQIVNNKSQTFIICPLVEESESETLKDVRSVKKEFNNLSTIF